MTARTDPETPLTRVLFTRHLRTDAGLPGRWDYTITAYSRQVVLTPELLQGVVQQAYDQAGIRAAGSGRTDAEVTRAEAQQVLALVREVAALREALREVLMDWTDCGFLEGCSCSAARAQRLLLGVES